MDNKTTRFLRLSAIAAVVLAIAVVECAVAQAPAPGNYSSARYEIQSSRGHRVAMRDGIHLSVDIYQPDASGRYPALLEITPYNNNGGGALQQRAQWFAKRGYVVVLADTRGRYDSDGEWDPFNPKQKTDGYDLVEWIAKQPWCNGRVGMYGSSYSGWETWWTATQAPPSLKAIVPEVAPPDQMRNIPYQDGVLVGWMFDWEAAMAGRTMQKIGDGAYNGFTDRRAPDLMHAPYGELNRIRGVMDAPWFETWMQQNLSTAGYWKAISYQTPESYSKVTVPSLAISGWFDCNHPGTPMNFIGMKQHGATPEARRPRLVIGPWTHSVGKRPSAGADYGPDAVIDWDGYVMRWFDRFLKGIDNGVENDPVVHVFVMGANKWRAESDWPLPQTLWAKYYFHSQGKANSLKGDGLLSPKPPRENASDKYSYDPARPTQSPTAVSGHLDGAMDTRLSAIGDDVLVYQTPPLESALEVTGPIEATLYATTSAHDTDWFVRLVDVQPDGRSLLLAEGAMRARNRDPGNNGRFNSAQLSTIEPGKVYPYTIQFWRGTGNLFQRGHRIRVEISSSWYPYYAPNLNSGADNLATVSRSQAIVARQTVHHGPKYPSHILLPVIPGSAER